MEQTFIAGLAIGLFAGWLIEFLIDFFFWRRGNSAAGMTSKQLIDANLSLATASQHISTLDMELVELSTRNTALNTALTDSRREIENLRAQLATIAAFESGELTDVEPRPDELEPSSDLIIDNPPDDFMEVAAQTSATDTTDDIDAFRRAAAKVSA